MDAAHEEDFRTLLEAFSEFCDDNGTSENGLIAFKTYFCNNYFHRAEVWAACFRKEANINTNMRLEALHRVIKYCYLGGKQNKRVDKLISVLLKLIRDKVFERLIKFSKNAESSFARETRMKHNAGTNIPEDDIECSAAREWIIQSQSCPTVKYTVTQSQNTICKKMCTFSCPDCSICIHSVTCTCTDNTTRRSLCKHLHAVFKQSNEGGLVQTLHAEEVCFYFRSQLIL